MCNQDKRCNLTQCHTGVKLKGPDDEEDELDEVMGSPQSSLIMPSVPSLEDSSLGEQDSMSTNALAEDERTAEAAGRLKDESQVSGCSLTHADHICMTCSRCGLCNPLQDSGDFSGTVFAISMALYLWHMLAQLLQELTTCSSTNIS